MRRKGFSPKHLVIFLIILIASSFTFFLIGKKYSDFNNEETYQYSIANVRLNYPKNKYQIYEPQPNPDDHSILSNFWLLTTKGGITVIEGEFYNATVRTGIRFMDDFVTKNALEQTTIGYRGINKGAQVIAYTKTEEGKMVYNFPISTDSSLYVLRLSISEKLANDPVIQRILLSVYTN